MSQSSKHIALWLVLALVFLVIFSVFSKQHGREPEIVFSEFMGSVDRGEVQEVLIQGHSLQGKYKSGERFSPDSVAERAAKPSPRLRRPRSTAPPHRCQCNHDLHLLCRASAGVPIRAELTLVVTGIARQT